MFIKQQRKDTIIKNLRCAQGREGETRRKPGKLGPASERQSQRSLGKHRSCHHPRIGRCPPIDNSDKALICSICLHPCRKYSHQGQCLWPWMDKLPIAVPGKGWTPSNTSSQEMGMKSSCRMPGTDPGGRQGTGQYPQSISRWTWHGSAAPFKGAKRDSNGLVCLAPVFGPPGDNTREASTWETRG